MPLAAETASSEKGGRPLVPWATAKRIGCGDAPNRKGRERRLHFTAQASVVDGFFEIDHRIGKSSPHFGLQAQVVDDDLDALQRDRVVRVRTESIGLLGHMRRDVLDAGSDPHKKRRIDVVLDVSFVPKG